jgi:putative CocE/NonD family hydrolase
MPTALPPVRPARVLHEPFAANAPDPCWTTSIHRFGSSTACASRLRAESTYLLASNALSRSRDKVRAISGLALLLALILASGCSTPPARSAAGPPPTVDAGEDLADFIRASYEKTEHLVPMRDGVRLSTTIYAPRDRSRTYPIILARTPYSCRPYGKDEYRTGLGPTRAFARDGYIFVYQDVRGKYMSEGEFVNMRPHVDVKRSATDVDESSDTWDTIEWLLDHIPNDNGRVGMWGISYPGFYAAAGMIDAHPALVAVSPQAPIADWWYDDFHHHGAFFLPHCFNFFASFGRPRPGPTTEGHPRFDHGTPDGYQFFLELGPLSNANTLYFKDGVAFWNQIVAHPNYDEFWQARNILPHLHDVAPAVMTVGGWFDAEDLYGPLQIYRAVERENPDVFNVMVMGPWAHGGWSRSAGRRLGNIDFGADTSDFYREQLLRPFFRHHLKDEGPCPLAEATVFDTGALRWHGFDQWPPADLRPATLHLAADGGLDFAGPAGATGDHDAFVSDPARPVPFTEAIARGMTREYMTDDQRFAARRPDVLVYQTEPLEDDVTLAGPVVADLWVSTSESAADWVVKLIDVLPPDAPDHDGLPDGRHLGGYQMMVRSEVIRGRFRNDPSRPEPFVPGQPTRVRLELQDVMHTFRAGHRIMVQVQSTWFPLVDRNPQRYVDNIFLARPEDFVAATHRVYRGGAHASRIEVGLLPASALEPSVLDPDRPLVASGR